MPWPASHAATKPSTRLSTSSASYGGSTRPVPSTSPIPRRRERIALEIYIRLLEGPYLTADGLRFIEDAIGSTEAWIDRAALVSVPTDPIDAAIAKAVKEATAPLIAAIEETLEEISYWHSDTLTEQERRHPRGSGWARVWDKCQAAIANVTERAA